MRQVVYVGLLGCFILGSNSTPVEGSDEKGEIPLPEKLEESKENKIPAAAADGGHDREVAPKSPCPSGALYFRQNCYEYVGTSVSWFSAEIQCQNRRVDGHLVSFASLMEEKMVSTYIKDRSSSTTYVWIGLNAAPNHSGKSLVWEWSDGSPYTCGTPLWDNRTPSTSISDTTCLLLSNIQQPANSVRWVANKCDASWTYVCKYRA